MSATTAMFTLAGIWDRDGTVAGAGHGPPRPRPVRLVAARHPSWPPGPPPRPVRRTAPRRAGAQQLGIGVPGRGPIDVLVGLDGSPEAGAALLTVLDLLGPQLGRLTLAAGHRPGCLGRARPRKGPGAGRAAAASRSDPQAVVEPRTGPGRTRRALSRPDPAARAAGGGVAAAGRGGRLRLVVVGGRGSGLSKVLLGSTATALAAQAKVPVLLAGGGSPAD